MIRGLLMANAYSGVFLDTPSAANNRIIGNRSASTAITRCHAATPACG
jgi:hypothetical protein